MNAASIVRRLIEEEPNSDPLGIGPLDRYIGPVGFNNDVKDILDHALFLKEQAQEAGALSPNMLAGISEKDVNRAVLRIACDELDDEPRVTKAVIRLRREMHSIWS